MARALKNPPKFPSWEKEEQFWETHSTAEFNFEEVPQEEYLRLHPQRKVHRQVREIQLKNPFAA
jgi:hypothetical protein